MSAGTASPSPAGSPAKTRAAIGVRTLRTDRWWEGPAVTATLLVAWLLYALVRTATQADYFAEKYHYLSPFSSPCVSSSCAAGAQDFGAWFGHFPPILPFGIVVLPILLLFRLSCYYYRGAYYKAFWLSPPSCAVQEPHARYSGETRLPLILHNSHRWFFYLAVIVSAINTYDAVLAFQGVGGGVGMGLGTLIMVANVVLLWGYTLGCHSCRHIVGGRLRNFSRHPLRYRFWTFVSRLNARHMALAWTTLATLALTDGYIALVAGGVFSDPRFFN